MTASEVSRTRGRNTVCAAAAGLALVAATYGVVGAVSPDAGAGAGAALDYGPGSHTAQAVAAGTPAQLDARVTGSVALSGGGDGGGGGSISTAADIDGLTVLPSGRLLALTGATGPGARGAGLVLSVDPATGRSQPIERIEVDQQYLHSAGTQPQLAAGWTLGAVPTLSDSAVMVGTGGRFGVLDDYTPAAPGSGAFAGVITDQAGSPTGPITGACGDSPEAVDPMIWTTSGSNVIERREFPTSTSTGTAPEVVMLVSPMMELEPAQRDLASQDGSQALPRLTPSPAVSVGGLRSLNCLDRAQIHALREVTGIADTVLRGSTEAPVTSTALVAVVDRELAADWFERGSVPGEGVKTVPGQHYSGELIGQATGTGEHRLDAVVVDSVTGTAVAGIHLTGPGVPADAQVTALAMDASGTGGWAAVAGQQTLLRFELG